MTVTEPPAKQLMEVPVWEGRTLRRQLAPSVGR